MLITDQFVMLNFPKTGSSFVRKVLKEIHRMRDKRDWMIKWRFKRPSLREVKVVVHDPVQNIRLKSQHGTYRQIPEKIRRDIVVSVMRNPFSRYVSAYAFRWWEKYPPAGLETLCKAYPRFPDISFADYYEMAHRFTVANHLNGIKPSIELGLSTVQFIQFYFYDPESVFRKINEEYIETEAFREDMANIHFLHQETLRDDLASFLKQMHYSDEEIELVRQYPRVNVTNWKTRRNDKDSFYTPELVEKVKRLDALIFKIFPEYLSEAV